LGNEVVCDTRLGPQRDQYSDVAASDLLRGVEGHQADMEYKTMQIKKQARHFMFFLIGIDR
jgi:hypothetical protein